MLDLDLMLKRNELCVVGMDPARDATRQAGLYVRDTRFLSAFSVRLSATELQLLDVQTPAPDRAIITHTNPSRASSEGAPEAQTLLVRSEVTLDTALVVAMTVRNFGRAAMSQRLELELAADFKDMFDVRGMVPKNGPCRSPPSRSMTGRSGSPRVARTGRWSRRASPPRPLAARCPWPVATPAPPLPLPHAIRRIELPLHTY